MADYRIYEDFSPESNQKYAKKLAVLEQKLAEVPWLPDKNVSLLAIPISTSGYGRENSGHAHSTLGWCGVSERFLDSDDLSIATALAYHERTHLQVGSELRQMILEKHGDIDTFLREVVMPDWTSGKVNLQADKDYLTHKLWDALYDGWTGLDLNLEKAKTAVDRYFTLLIKGLIRLAPSGRIIHPSPVFPDDWEEEIAKPDLSLRELYARNPHQFATLLITGYELAKYLQERYRDAVSRQHKVILWVVEEGFANYVATGLSDVSLNEFNRWAPQDTGKIELARRIMAADTGGVHSAIRDVKSYQDFISFLRRIGMLRTTE